MVQIVDRQKAIELLAPYTGTEQQLFNPDDSYGFQPMPGEKIGFAFDSKKNTTPVSLSAWDTVYKASGLPANAMQKFPSDLVLPLVNHAFKSYGKEMQAVHKDGQIIAFTPANVVVRDPIQTMRILERTIGGKKHIKGYDVYANFGRQYINVVGDKDANMGGKVIERGTGIKVGDIVGGGISLYTSPFGLPAPGSNVNSSLDLSGFVHRYACTNGMISTQNIATMTKRDTEGDEDEWIRTNAEKVYASIDQEFEKFKALKDIPLDEHLEQAIQSFFAEFSIPPQVRDLVMRRIEQDKPRNVYDLVNSITYVGSNFRVIRDNADIVRKIMRFGGGIMYHNAICNACHRALPRRERRLATLSQEA